MHSPQVYARELGRRTRIWVERDAWRAFHPILRSIATRRTLATGKVTVVAVSYKSFDYLPIFTRALSRYWYERIDQVIIIDNASRDGSRRWLKERRHAIRSVVLPMNIMHGPALDIGVFLSRTEFFVTLDIDAFPIQPGWLDRILTPLHQGAAVAGARVEVAQPTPLPDGAYVHPCFCAMRTSHFINSNYSFAPVRQGRQLVLDTGALISL